MLLDTILSNCIQIDKCYKCAQQTRGHNKNICMNFEKENTYSEKQTINKWMMANIFQSNIYERNYLWKSRNYAPCLAYNIKIYFYLFDTIQYFARTLKELLGTL